MKRLFILLMGLWLTTISAESPSMEIEWNEPEIQSQNPFGINDMVLLSFMWYESRYDSTAINPVSGARGVLQILPIMIEEANRLQKLYHSPIRYTWDDAWSVSRSIEIWYLVQQHHNPDYDLQKACQIWFGKGVQYDGMTWVEYHNAVFQYLSTLSNIEIT